jgi:hypothetical protein
MTKQVSIKVYEANELGQEALEQAKFKYICEQSPPWIDEVIESFRSFAEHLGGKIDYAVSDNSTPGDHAKIIMDEVYYYSDRHGDFFPLDTDMKNEKLMEYLEDHFPESLKYFGDDEILIGVVRDFMKIMKNPKTKNNGYYKDYTLDDLLKDVSDKFLEIGQAEYQYFQTKEHFLEMAECNDWTFLEDGTFFRGEPS